LVNTAEGGAQPHCDLEQRRRNAAKINEGPDVGLFALIRVLRTAQRSSAAAGDADRAAYFGYVSDVVRASTGAARDRLRQFAEKKGLVAHV
jgi:hypothetical protein